MTNLVYFIPLVISLTLHEFAHAFTADRLGDPTPRANGRLSLNPLAHLDPLGTLMLIFAGIGWGKPVPIDPYNLSHPRRDELLISLAGPLSNLILAAILSLFHLPLFQILIIINVSLAVFNLLPIPPLDGSKIFLNLLPEDQSREWQQAFGQYGYLLLAILLFLPIGSSNLINLIISPIIGFILQTLQLL